MRDDDRHVGEIHRDVIEVNRIGVFEAQSAAARHAGADAGMAAVEDRRQLVLGNHLIERIRHPGVREETLDGGVELEAADRAGLEQTARLAHAHPSVRVDARKGDHDVTVLASRIGNLLIRNPPSADLEFRIDREHHQADLSLAIVRDGLGNGRAFPYLEVPAGGFIVWLPRLVMRLPAGHFGMGVNVDGAQVLDVHKERSQSAMLRPERTSSTSSGAGCQCMEPKILRYFSIPASTVPGPSVSGVLYPSCLQSVISGRARRPLEAELATRHEGSLTDRLGAAEHRQLCEALRAIAEL